MITYNPGKWSIGFAFSLHGSVFPKSLAWALPCAVLAVALHIFFHSGDEGVMDAMGAGDTAASVLGGFTFILGFLVVFRSQQAYSRWWEGGTLLQQLRGEWFNSYSCLLAFCNSDPDKAVEVKDLQHQLVRLYSLLYACALHQVSTQKDAIFELVTMDGFENSSLDFLWQSPDRCEVVLQWIQRLIVESNQKELLRIAPPILSRVFNELGNGIVNLNNARKITEFPIPFPLAQMITVMLLFHAAVTPVICAATVKTSYWAGLISFVVIFSYWTINYIAVELEMPFGEDANDLPLQAMQADMNRSLCMLIDTRAQQVPKFIFDPTFHDKLQTSEVDFDKITAGEQFSAMSSGERLAMKRGRTRRVSSDGSDARPEAMTEVANAPETLPLETPEDLRYQSDLLAGAGNAAGPPLHAFDVKPQEHVQPVVRTMSAAPAGAVTLRVHADCPQISGVPEDLRTCDPDRLERQWPGEARTARAADCRAPGQSILV